MVATAPEIYRPFVTYGKKSELVLYVKLWKALYGCLKTGLLVYEKLVGDFEGIGFKVNLYDACVANAVIKVQQLKICWHVEDLKVSHADKKQVSKMIRWLSKKYETIGKMKVSRGKSTTI